MAKRMARPKMPSVVKDRLDGLDVEWGRALEYGSAKAAHRLSLRFRSGDDPEKVQAVALAYLRDLVDYELKGGE